MSCNTTPPAAELQTAWDRFRDAFLEEYFLLNPAEAVDLGRHEFDGQLPDWSEEGLERSVEFFKQRRREALEFDAESLSEARRFERDYLLAAIDGELFWRETADWPRRNPAYYTGKLNPSVYLTRPYAPLKQRMDAYIEFCRNLPEALERMKQNLRTPMPETYVELGRLSAGGMASYFEKDVPRIFAEVDDDLLQARFADANLRAAEALRSLDGWFAKQEKTATDDFALGAELFSQMLAATEQVDLPLDELERIGREDMERNLQALEQTCAKYAPGADLAACVDKARANKPEGGPVEGARGQLDRLKKFLLEKDLVTIPGGEEALVDEAPPYARWNFAYIEIPGPYEKGLPSVYYIAPPDPDWSPEVQQDYLPGRADLLFVSIHEVWPGHFLHYLHANRADSKLGQVFTSYAFTEGWAHYAEELMWEAGFGDGDPEIHIGQLLNALLRNARYLSAIGLHTGKMTVADAEELFREKALQDAGNAKQQAARGTFDPGYLNYTLGKLLIRKLREDWTAPRGGREAWRAFHDELLSLGGPPLPLARRALLEEEAGGIL